MAFVSGNAQLAAVARSELVFAIEFGNHGLPIGKVQMHKGLAAEVFEDLNGALEGALVIDLQMFGADAECDMAIRVCAVAHAAVTQRDGAALALSIEKVHGR